MPVMMRDRPRSEDILADIKSQGYVATNVVYSDAYSTVIVEVRNITDVAHVVFVHMDKRSQRKTEHATLASALALI